MMSNGKKISERKLPENGAHLAKYHRERGSDAAAAFFEEFKDYQLVDNGKVKQSESREIPLGTDVLNDIFKSIETKNGTRAYKSVSMKTVDPCEITRLQTFVFKDVLKNIEENVHGKYSLPALYVDEKKQIMTIYMPPITEAHGSRDVLIDGMHRCYHSMDKGEEITILVCETMNGLRLPANMRGRMKNMQGDLDVLDKYIPTGGRDTLERPKFSGLIPEQFRMYSKAGFGTSGADKYSSGENK